MLIFRYKEACFLKFYITAAFFLLLGDPQYECLSIYLI